MDKQQSAAAGPFKIVLNSTILHVVLLVVIVLGCWGRTLTTYFLADDFGEIAYVSRIFHGEGHLLWSNWVGNYMQIPGMSVWRPWLLMTIVFDYLLYGTKSVGYYASNLIYYGGCVLMLYANVRVLTQHWTNGWSRFAAFFAGAFFALSPLRCESVSWMVGRVDITCCLFYQLGLYAFLKQRSSKKLIWAVLGTLSFWIGIFTKEMAVGLPVVVAAVEFFGIGSQSDTRSFRERLISALKLSAPLLVSLVLYFILRFAFLGTLVGGYVAGFGAAQGSAMWQRWLDPDTLHRYIFPFPTAIFHPHSSYERFLALSYSVFTGLLILQFFRKRVGWRMPLFLALWLATAAAPIFQLWGIGFNLEGARFYLFISMVVSASLPILFFSSANSRGNRIDCLTKCAAMAAGLLALFMLGKSTLVANRVWVKAGQEVRSVFDNAKSLVTENGADKTICLLGIPAERNGAHQILNGPTFATMLKPPFVEKPIADIFITSQPIMFSPSQYINATVLKTGLLAKNGVGPYVWSHDDLKFELRKLPPTAGAAVSEITLPLPQATTGWTPYSAGHAQVSVKDGAIKFEKSRVGDGLRVGDLHVNPLDYDYLEFKARGALSLSEDSFKVRFGSRQTANQDPPESEAEDNIASVMWRGSQNYSTVRVRLSHFWRWFSVGEISELVLLLPASDSLELKDFKLVPARELQPSLVIEGEQPDNRGVLAVSDSKPVRLSANFSGVKGATGVKVEIGKPNYFFDNFENLPSVDPVAKTIDASKGCTVDFSNFPIAGFYQIRARCLDADGKPVGQPSDYVTLWRQK